MNGSVNATVCCVCGGSCNISNSKDEADEFGKKVGNIWGTIISCVHTSYSYYEQSIISLST
jgi:hypothetical protein